jgi:hypothetical protein
MPSTFRGIACVDRISNRLLSCPPIPIRKVYIGSTRTSWCDGEYLARCGQVRCSERRMSSDSLWSSGCVGAVCTTSRLTSRGSRHLVRLTAVQSNVGLEIHDQKSASRFQNAPIINTMCNFESIKRQPRFRNCGWQIASHQLLEVCHSQPRASLRS